MSTEEEQNEPGIVLGLSLLSLQLALMIGSLVNGVHLGPIHKGTSEVFMGLYIQGWGVLFLLSYFFEKKSFLFRALMWVCENFSSPKGRGMAFFYFALAFGLGTVSLLVGLGIVG